MSDNSTLPMTSSSRINSSQLKPLWGGPTSFGFYENVGSTAIVDSSSSISLHHFDLACENCHKQDSFENGIEIGSAFLKSEVDINNSCTLSGCHEYEPILNHPIGTNPRSVVPSDMPLDSFGQITCLTCHDQQTPNVQNKSKDRPLRTPDGIDFCSSCHSQMPGTAKEQSHWQFSSKAHLGSINPDSSRKDTTLVFGMLDTESQNCLSCHEEITATVSGDFGRSQHANGKDIMSNHPIGMNYSSVVSQNTLKYNNLSRSGQHIRLFEGKLGCGTCHSLYSGIKKNLVQNNRGSSLCFECHNM